ncbi:toll/interleukin-1 receptor domain-containing protein [Streptomyces sp. NBC_01285]|uniref:toll/interleukin-1 receptor domain-containing protein n=1 Tax=Streptomyces sp. NBC_01285 TaxID=2903813 RepID=UPI002253EB4B|nr:toll/interleukin-1 receptor domain-containing protein [Streptomyces sp. NBC_01285]MCX4768964.1 toll/interleukin-1 receptor domain-containing protein [Streptomyces sp. NBC_01285]
MKIFISWSGDASKECAEVLGDWLPLTNQTITPFVSSQDISKGERGLAKIASQLQACSFGIVCVTRGNQAAPWINFEAGALSRELGESALIPFLLDMPIKDLSGPLSQFQATDSSSEDDVWSMVRAINEKCETSVDQDRLKKAFDAFWSEFKSKLSGIRSARASTEGAPERDTPDILNELVGLVREQSSRIGSLERNLEKVRNVTSHYSINEPHEVVISSESEETAVQRRANAASRRLREILGPVDAKRMRRTGYGIRVECDPAHKNRLWGLEGELQELAQKYEIGLDIVCGEEVMALPPF